MKINCISCGHNVDIDDDAYETYTGQIKCFACGAILTVSIEEGHVKAVNFVEAAPHPIITRKSHKSHAIM